MIILPNVTKLPARYHLPFQLLVIPVCGVGYNAPWVRNGEKRKGRKKIRSNEGKRRNRKEHLKSNKWSRNSGEQEAEEERVKTCLS